MNITVTVQDLATPRLRSLMQNLSRPRGMHTVMGQRVAVALRQHFISKNASSPNENGWPRQNFWNRFQHVTSRADDLAATVTIPDPQGALRHKISGGTVTPKRGRALAIPLTPEAYALGSRASYRDAFPDAFIFKGKKFAFLARPGGEKGKLRLLALLLPRVTHHADPTAMPPAESLRAEAITGVRNYLSRMDQRGGGN